MEVEWTLQPDDVEWKMEWGEKAQSEGKPAVEMIFEPAGALALMLINEVVFLNDHWWEKEWPEDARKAISVHVNCNDVFAWGCADGEELPYSEIENCYRMWRDKPWGAAVWCLIQRKEMPQRPVEKSMRDAGWDLDSLRQEHGLRANHYDGISQVMAVRKYEAYCHWEHGRGGTPRPYDKDWWDGWGEYIEASPGWCDDAWKTEDDRLCAEWRKANGFD